MSIINVPGTISFCAVACGAGWALEGEVVVSAVMAVVAYLVRIGGNIGYKGRDLLVVTH
jgi:hypothetical protein